MKKFIIVASFVFIFLSPTVFASSFPDVPDSYLNLEAIEYVKENDIFSGYPDGTFSPDNSISRAELVKVIVLAFVDGSPALIDDYFKKNYLDKDYSYASFKDVLSDQWYAKYVAYAYGQGWVSGYPDGLFRPAEPVSLVESLKMIIEASDSTLKGNVYYSEFVEGMSSNNWFNEYIVSAHLKNILSLYDNGAFFKFLFSNPLNLQVDKMDYDENTKRAYIAELLYRFIVSDNDEKKCFAPAVSDWQNHKDSSFGLSVKYPPSFSVNDSFGEYSEEDGDVVKKITFGDLSSFYSILVVKPSSSSLSLEQYLLNKAGSALLVISDITVNGVAGKYFDENNSVFGAEGIALKSGEYIYYIVSNSKEYCNLFETFWKSVILD